MKASLVFIHGRAQEHRNAIDLKNEWICALMGGLAKNSLDLPLPETDIKFPYYGQTLYDLVEDTGNVADVITRGGVGMDEEQRFQEAIILEMQEKLKMKYKVTDADVRKSLDLEVIQCGPQNWEWVHGILKTIDQNVPCASCATISLVTRDVYQYLKNPGIRDKIETGVLQAMQPEVPTVVVSHSLGTVVAYNLLRREGMSLGWNVPLFVTLGSPLAVKMIKQSLAPIQHPQCVRQWFNAMDEHDIVALYPLTKKHFDVDPQIENKTDVDNHTSDHHGIDGYLDDACVAKFIYEALIS